MDEVAVDIYIIDLGSGHQFKCVCLYVSVFSCVACLLICFCYRNALTFMFFFYVICYLGETIGPLQTICLWQGIERKARNKKHEELTADITPSLKVPANHPLLPSLINKSEVTLKLLMVNSICTADAGASKVILLGHMFDAQERFYSSELTCVGYRSFEHDITNELAPRERVI